MSGTMSAAALHHLVPRRLQRLLAGLVLLDQPAQRVEPLLGRHPAERLLLLHRGGLTERVLVAEARPQLLGGELLVERRRRRRNLGRGRLRSDIARLGERRWHPGQRRRSCTAGYRRLRSTTSRISTAGRCSRGSCVRAGHETIPNPHDAPAVPVITGSLHWNHNASQAFSEGPPPRSGGSPRNRP